MFDPENIPLLESLRSLNQGLPPLVRSHGNDRTRRMRTRPQAMELLGGENRLDQAGREYALEVGLVDPDVVVRSTRPKLQVHQECQEQAISERSPSQGRGFVIAQAHRYQLKDHRLPLRHSQYVEPRSPSLAQKIGCEGLPRLPPLPVRSLGQFRGKEL